MKTIINLLKNKLLNLLKKTTGITAVFCLIIIGSSGDLNAQLASCHNKFVGNIWYNGNMPLNYDQYFNQLTPENSTKWSAVQGGGPNSWNWGPALSMYNYCQSRGIPFKFHTLVWGNQYPSWLDNTLNKAAAVENWMREAGQTFPDCDFVDVVNECLPNHAQPSWLSAIGGANGLYGTGWDWVVWSFEKARQYFPNSKLLINDYNILNNSWNNDLDVLCEIVNILNSRGLIDGIGLQSHGLANVSGTDVSARLNRITTLCPGVPIYISEFDLDIADDNQQRNKMAEIFPVFWNNPAVHGITFWGYVQGHTWIPNSHLIRSDGSERPAMVWLKDYLECSGGGCTGVTNLPNGAYTISARHSGMCLEVANSSISDGGNVIQSACDESAAQQWVVSQTNGGYTFTNVNSGKCLDVAGGGTADGTNIQQWACLGNAAQSFCLQDAGSGYYEIVNSGSGKNVDVEGISTADGANIHQWSSHGGENQQFLFTPVGGSGGTFNGVYSLVAQHSGKAVDTYNFGTANGTNIVQWSYWGGDAQRYQIAHLGGGWHRISPVIATGQALDVADISSANGANIQTWAWGGGNNQQWRFEDAGNGNWKIIARHSGKCLDVDGISTADGANIHQWDCIPGAQNQAFDVIPQGGARLAMDESLQENGDFKLYPNPSAGGIFTVDLLDTDRKGYRLSIFNLEGKKVFESDELKSGAHRISSGLQKGMYFVKTEGTTIVKKLIVR